MASGYARIRGVTADDFAAIYAETENGHPTWPAMIGQVESWSPSDMEAETYQFLDLKAVLSHAAAGGHGLLINYAKRW